MSEKHDFWLVLEPFVQALIKGDKALFYNTLSQHVVEIQTDKHTDKLIKQLLLPKNGYVTGIGHVTLQQPSVKFLIHALRRKYMADLRPVDSSGNKPVNLFPSPVMKNGFKNDFPETEDYFLEVTLHLSTYSASQKQNIRSEAFKQFVYPIVSTHIKKEMDAPLFHRLMDQLSPMPQLRINILGMDILKNKTQDHFHNQLKKLTSQKFYHFIIAGNNLKYLPRMGKNDIPVFMISPPFNSSLTKRLIRIKEKIGIRIKPEYNFIVEKNRDVEKAKDIIKELHLTDTYFKPYFNGQNAAFFEENIYLDPEDILSSKPSQKQVFSRIMLNENDFGKLTVFPDGSVFANTNDKPLGNIKHSGFREIIKKEIQQGKSWKRTRMKLMPCNKCIYQWLCPPVSSYEIFIGKFDFCSINQQ